jgi:HEAT repeat protein
MKINGRKASYFLGLCITLGILSGCMGDPIYRLWHRRQWMDDQNYGTTLYERLDELSAIRDRAEDLSQAEQATIAQNMIAALHNDPSPVYRSHVVRTLALLTNPLAAEGLQLALQDSDPNVRIEACGAWGNRGGPEAVATLSRVLATDSKLDVRLAATRELGRFQDPAAVTALGVALDDADPALQYRAVQSLKSVTGKDLGNNVPAWRQYVREGTIPPGAERSLADKVRDLF